MPANVAQRLRGVQGAERASDERSREEQKRNGMEAVESPAWVPPTWDEVVREHADRVYRLAYRLSGNRADAEDLTQETVVRVFKSRAEYTPGTVEGWLHRITTNRFLDMVRGRQRIRFDPWADDACDRRAG